MFLCSLCSPEVEALMNLEQKCGAIVDLLEGLRDDGTAGDFFILVLKVRSQD